MKTVKFVPLWLVNDIAKARGSGNSVEEFVRDIAAAKMVHAGNISQEVFKGLRSDRRLRVKWSKNKVVNKGA